MRSLLVAGAAALVVLSTSGSAFARPGAGSPKVGRAVHDSLGAGGATQTVIITLKPGFRDTIRKALQDHGDVITSEHPLINAPSVIEQADGDNIVCGTWDSDNVVWGPAVPGGKGGSF